MSNSSSCILNDLIETLKDGQEGFRAAAEDVEQSNLKTIFGELSLQRSKFAGELQTLARSLSGEEPEETGSVAAAVHRGWIDLKAALVSRNAHAILAECERGEDSAVAEYRKAIESGKLPANVLETVKAQAAAVQESHDKIRGLRDAIPA
jgi:uncharacterized protein (TIGR02284 family)